MLDWDADDQLAAVTSVANETEACPGCGLRPDQMTSVNAALTRCPGCEARQREHRKIGEHDRGMLTVFEHVADARDSVWARLTRKGAEWANRHRHDPGPLYVTDPDNPDG